MKWLIKPKRPRQIGLQKDLREKSHETLKPKTLIGPRDPERHSYESAQLPTKYHEHPYLNWTSFSVFPEKQVDKSYSTGPSERKAASPGYMAEWLKDYYVPGESQADSAFEKPDDYTSTPQSGAVKTRFHPTDFVLYQKNFKGKRPFFIRKLMSSATGIRNVLTLLYAVLSRLGRLHDRLNEKQTGEDNQKLEAIISRNIEEVQDHLKKFYVFVVGIEDVPNELKQFLAEAVKLPAEAFTDPRIIENQVQELRRFESQFYELLGL